MLSLDVGKDAGAPRLIHVLLGVRRYVVCSVGQTFDQTVLNAIKHAERYTKNDH